jgi:hypothetical protein
MESRGLYLTGGTMDEAIVLERPLADGALQVVTRGAAGWRSLLAEGVMSFVTEAGLMLSPCLFRPGGRISIAHDHFG